MIGYIVEIGMSGWAGTTWKKCVVVAETPKRYRVRALHGETLTLTGMRKICGDQTVLIPKRAVRSDPDLRGST